MEVIKIPTERDENNSQIIQPVYQYIIKPGDTLFYISQRNNIPLGTLIAANPQIKNPDLIYPGEKIYIPKPKEIHKGKTTHYKHEEWHCYEVPPQGYYIAAVNISDYNKGLMCGAYLEVTNWLNTIKVLVVDSMGKDKDYIDLEEKAFQKITRLSRGIIGTTWRIIPLEFTDPNDNKIKYHFGSDSTEYYISLQLRNHLYPVKKLEYFDKKTEKYIELKRRTDGIFTKVNPRQKSFNFRITSIYNQVIIDKDIKLTPGKTVVGNTQFKNLHYPESLN